VCKNFNISEKELFKILEPLRSEGKIIVREEIITMPSSLAIA